MATTPTPPPSAQPTPDWYEEALTKSTFTHTYTASSVIVTLSIGLALYNTLEMILLITTTFKKRRGLYFYSLCVNTFGVFAYTIGILLTYFELSALWFGKTVLDVGWISMIVFQSGVLYSRLGLVLDNARVLFGVKWMIIVDSIVLVVPTIVLDFGNTYTGLVSMYQGYYYIEHIQVTMFTVQELVISGLYVWSTIRLLKVLQRQKTRSVIGQLLVMNIIIIVMDISLVVLQFKHLQLFQESLKAFFYSVKLKLELNILSKLVDLVGGDETTRHNRSMALDIEEPTTIAGQRVDSHASGAGVGRRRFEGSREEKDKGELKSFEHERLNGPVENGQLSEPIENGSVGRPAFRSSVNMAMATSSSDYDRIMRITSID